MANERLKELGNGWQGRGTAQTRVAFHEDGATIVWQDGTLIADAAGVTPAVLAFLFADKMPADQPAPTEAAPQGAPDVDDHDCRPGCAECDAHTSGVE